MIPNRSASLPPRRHGASREHGSVAVELALLLPVLATFAAFAFQFGQICRLQNAMQRVAQSGARALSLAPPALFGQQLQGIAAQMLQDLRAAGFPAATAGGIALECLDVALASFDAPPPFCQPGSAASADGTLGYVQATVTLPASAAASGFAFFLPSGNGAGQPFPGPQSFAASALYRYAPR